MQQTRLLGFAPLAGRTRFMPQCSAIPGPEVHMQAGPAVVALFQHEAARAARRPRPGGADRRPADRCSAGWRPAAPPDRSCRWIPPLPAVPAAAVPPLLEAAWNVLAEAVAAHGGRQQWDIVLRWAAGSRGGAPPL